MRIQEMEAGKSGGPGNSLEEAQSGRGRKKESGKKFEKRPQQGRDC